MRDRALGTDRSWGLIEALPPPRHEAQVAVVDRDGLVRSTLAGFARDLGYQASAFLSATELAAAVLKGQCSPAVVVAELAHDGPDPRRVLFDLHRARPWVPVVITDTCGLHLDAAEAVACGVHAWLRKPIRLAEFELLLHRLGRRLATDAYHDELTGLHNRRGFYVLGEQHLRFAARAGRELSYLAPRVRPTDAGGVLLEDGASDAAVLAFGGIVQATFRDSDIVGRTGYHDFGVLLLDTPEVGAHLATGRLVSNVIAWNGRAADDLRLAVEVAKSHYHPTEPCSLDRLMTATA